MFGQVLDALDDPKMAARLLDHPDPERARLLAELAEAEDLMNEAAELRGAGVYDKPRWERQFLPAKARADAARAGLAALPDPDIEMASAGPDPQPLGRPAAAPEAGRARPVPRGGRGRPGPSSRAAPT